MEIDKIFLLKNKMIEFFSNDPKRINHFLKVYSFGCLIGESENLDKETAFILEIATLVHDIGIKSSEEKYGSCNGKQQEIEGTSAAKKMLEEIGFDEKIIDRVTFLVGNHHTYSNIVGEDYQILVEADFLVNFYEDEMSIDSINECKKRIFKTKAGIKLCETMFQ